MMHLKDYCFVSRLLLFLNPGLSGPARARAVWTGVFLKQHFCFREVKTQGKNNIWW